MSPSTTASRSGTVRALSSSITDRLSTVASTRRTAFVLIRAHLGRERETPAVRGRCWRNVTPTLGQTCGFAPTLAEPAPDRRLEALAPDRVGPARTDGRELA